MEAIDGMGQGDATPGPDMEAVVEDFMKGALASVLDSARRSTSELVERTRVASEQHLAEATQLKEQAEDQSNRLAEYRKRVETMVRDVYAKVEDVRSHLQEVPTRMDAALAPLTEALSSMDDVMGDLSDALRPPDRVPDPDGGERAPVGAANDAADVHEAVSALVDDDVADDRAEEPAAVVRERVLPVASVAEPEPEPASEPSTAISAGDDQPAVGTSSSVWVDPPEDGGVWSSDAPAPAEASAPEIPEAPHASDASDAADEADDADEGSAPERDPSRRVRPSDIDWNDLPSAQAS